MCTSNIQNLSPFNNNTAFGKAGAVLDPLGNAVDDKLRPKLFPDRVPIAPPPGVQDFKDPDLTLMAKARKDASRAGPSTLLTSPSGVANQTFGSTLLGG